MIRNTKAATGGNGAASKNQSAERRIGLTEANIAQPLASLPEKKRGYQTCTRCHYSAQSLRLVVRLPHPSAPAEVARLCARCAGGFLPRPGQACQPSLFTHRELLRAQVVTLQARGVTVPGWLWQALHSVAVEFDRLSEGKEALA
jgi:hypothetical protein